MSFFNNIKELYNTINTRPEMVQRLLLVVGSTSIIAIILLSAWGFHRVFNGYVITSAENQATELCNLMLERISGHILTTRDGAQRVRVSPEAMDQVSGDIQALLRHFDVVKVKVFDETGRIVFSTDRSIIGRVDRHNRRLAEALAGITSSEFTVKSKVRDLDEEEHFTADVVETYVPINDSRGKIIGSFEIYMHVTRHRAAVRAGVTLATFILTFVLLSVFAVSHLVIASSMRQLKAAHAQLARVAVTDALTGLANHGYLVTKGAEEFERARRKLATAGEDAGLGCIMLDIDHFKKINDLHGHLVGDQVLQECAARMEKVKRRYDLLGRYGGEEFVMLLPETTSAEACLVAERLLACLRGTEIQVGSISVRVTASAGVSNSHAGDQSLSDLLERADNGLYLAKKEGRNRVVCQGDQATTAHANLP